MSGDVRMANGAEASEEEHRGAARLGTRCGHGQAASTRPATAGSGQEERMPLCGARGSGDGRWSAWALRKLPADLERRLRRGRNRRRGRIRASCDLSDRGRQVRCGDLRMTTDLAVRRGDIRLVVPGIRIGRDRSRAFAVARLGRAKDLEIGDQVVVDRLRAGHMERNKKQLKQEGRQSQRRNPRPAPPATQPGQPASSHLDPPAIRLAAWLPKVMNGSKRRLVKFVAAAEPFHARWTVAASEAAG